jgi:hypothetical protein
MRCRGEPAPAPDRFADRGRMVAGEDADHGGSASVPALAVADRWHADCNGTWREGSMITTSAAVSLGTSLGVGAAALAGTGLLAAALGWAAQSLFHALGL